MGYFARLIVKISYHIPSYFYKRQEFAGPSAQGVSDPRHHALFSLLFGSCSLDFLSIIPWISFFVVVLFIGSRFSSSWSLDFDSQCNLELTRRDIPEAPRGRSRPKLLPSDSPGDGYTPRDMSLKIALVFDQFFFVFRSIFWSKMPPKIDPKTFKNHFQNRLRF